MPIAWRLCETERFSEIFSAADQELLRVRLVLFGLNALDLCVAFAVMRANARPVSRSISNPNLQVNV
ncbi:MAG: hypothetical protein WDN29_00230 [Methylovirgula sp.]